MPQITYSIGGISFDAVPENLEHERRLPVGSQATIGRAMIHTLGVAAEKMTLSGRYMSVSVRSQIQDLFDQCAESGEPVVFNDGYVDRNALIQSFKTIPLVGKTEGCAFTIELLVTG